MKLYIIKTGSITLLFCSLVFTFSVNGQNVGCIDSITFNQYFPSYFEADGSNPTNSFSYKPQRDDSDNVYISGSTGFGGPFGYWSIIKFNARNQLVWYKNYRVDAGSTFKTGGAIQDIEPNGNLTFTRFLTSPGNPYAYWLLLSKTDNGGNLLWSKIYKHQTNPDFAGSVGIPHIYDDGNIFCTGRFQDAYDKPVVTAMDESGNILWTNRYQHLTTPKYHLLASLLVSQNSSTLVMALHYYYDADIETDPNAKFGVQLVKINKADGSILQQTSFMYYNDAAATIPNRAQLQKINYDTVSKRFVLVFEESGFGIHKFIFTLLDDNMNIVKTNFYSSSPNILPLTKISISKENVISLITPIQNPQKLKYAILNNDIEIITQKEISLNSIGFPNRNWQGDMAYKKNGILNFQLATYTTFLQDYLFLFDHSPFYNTISPCLGKDSVIYSPVPIYVFPVPNPVIEEAGTVALQVTTQVPDSPPVDFLLPKTEVCKEVSICDTIKLFGTNYHCLSNPLDSFKIIRNPLCKRVTNWQVDTNYIKILSQSDTALYVQYLLPYRGSIKVGFGGCALTDEIPIEVYAPRPPVSFGPDTMMLCPGKDITLNAGQGYKTYTWQDGSAAAQYLVTQPGNYRVTVTDSCGTVSSDSVTVTLSDTSLVIPAAQTICNRDTAYIPFPADINNITWQPANNALLNNNILRLYPLQSTLYNIIAERIPNCPIARTTSVTVKFCPEIVFIPNSFTPNNDGLNDIFKATSTKPLQAFRLAVFNRYGQKLFETSNPSEGWDGSFKNSPQSAGGYVYQCSYRFASGYQKNENGYFLLIR